MSVLSVVSTDKTLEEFVRSMDNKLENHTVVFKNVLCPDPFEPQKKHRFPLVVLSSGGVYPFVEVGFEQTKATELRDRVEYKLRVFSDCFRTQALSEVVFLLRPISEAQTQIQASISLDDYRAILYRPELPGATAFHKTEQTEMVETLEGLLLENTENESVLEKDFKVLTNQLAQHSPEAHKITSGPTFEQDPEKVFRLALFGGFLGLQRFYLKLYGSGVLYLCTLGLFGVGWFFDCLEILLSAWKKKGKRLRPIPNRTKHIREFLAVFGVVIAVLLLCI